jgi:hypothetical protein
MSIDMVRSVYAEDVEPGDQLDFAEDEYGWNENADQAYATVNRCTEWYDGTTGEPWVTLYTSQGDYEMPASHFVKKKVEE